MYLGPDSGKTRDMIDGRWLCVVVLIIDATGRRGASCSHSLLLLRLQPRLGSSPSASVGAEPHPSWSDRGFGFIGRSMFSTRQKSQLGKALIGKTVPIETLNFEYLAKF